MGGRNIIIGYDLTSYPLVIEINNREGVKYCTSPIMKNFLDSMNIMSDILFTSDTQQLYHPSGICEIEGNDRFFILKNTTKEERNYMDKEGLEYE